MTEKNCYTCHKKFVSYTVGDDFCSYDCEKIHIEMLNGPTSKRLRPESPAGSGAPSGCADAKRTSTSGAEEKERSDAPQTAAVAPGKVSEAIAYMEKVAAGFDGYAQGHGERGHPQLAAFNCGVAAGWRTASVVLESLLSTPNEPDSNAPIGASGRRNDQAKP
jgi:hypothetical protein